MTGLDFSLEAAEAVAGTDGLALAPSGQDCCALRAARELLDELLALLREQGG